MNEWVSKFFFCWGIFCAIAAIIELVIVFSKDNCGGPETSLWDNICVFFVLFPRFAFYAFLAAIGFTVIDFILFNLAEGFIHMHGYDVIPCSCGF